MAVATYGSESAHTLASVRGGALQRPFQIVVIAADFLLILLSYVAGASLYGAAVAWPADGASVGAGLFVGVVFVAVAYFRDVYATHRLLNLVWQLRKAVFIWLTSLTILAVAAFLLKSTDNLSRGTVIVFAVIGRLGLVSLRFVWQAVFGTSFARSRLVDRKVILLSLKPLDFHLEPLQGSAPEWLRCHASFRAWGRSGRRQLGAADSGCHPSVAFG